MRICILIPCHNEAQAIGALVRDIRQYSLDVVVVDDGSSDLTADIARQQGAKVITIQDRKGKGNAIQTGFVFVIDQGYDALIMMDGDGQHAVSDLPKFISKFVNTKASIINGNRMNDHKNMPLVRRITNYVMSWLISMVCHQKIVDSQCGFRLISSQVLRAIKLRSTNFEIESEILIKASRKGFKVDSVDIQTIYEDEKSKINPVIDTVRFLKFIVREMWSRES